MTRYPPVPEQLEEEADFGIPPHVDTTFFIPFFYNAAADFPMECLPTCHDADNPAKYPTISYNQSQAAAQGE